MAEQNVRLQNLRGATLRILNSSEKVIGTGFYIGQGLICTCAHVVESANGNLSDSISDSINIQIPGARGGNNRLSARIVASDRDKDIAILSSKDILNEISPEQALVLGNSQDVEGHSFSSYGFPELGNFSGIHSRGTITGRTTDNQDLVYLQLNSQELTQGMSGSPVLDLETNLVIGMVALTTNTRGNQQIRDIAFAIPSETLQQVHPQLILRQVGIQSRNQTEKKSPLPGNRQIPESQDLSSPPSFNTSQNQELQSHFQINMDFLGQSSKESNAALSTEYMNLLSCFLTIKGYRDLLFDPNGNLSNDFTNGFIDNVMKVDFNRIIMNLRDYGGEERRGVREAYQAMEEALKELYKVSGQSRDDVRIKALVSCRTNLENAYRQLEHLNKVIDELGFPKKATPLIRSANIEADQQPPTPSETSILESLPSESQSELTETVNPFRIQDNVLEKHAATDKPIQNVEQDKLGFNVYVTALRDFIVSQYTTTPLTISVDGPWGTGKSSLMYMLKNSLEPQNNAMQRFFTWVWTIFQSWKWGWLWFWAFPVQTFGKGLLRVALKFDKTTEEYDFRVGKNNTGFRSLITDIAQGLSINTEILMQESNNLAIRVIWWAKIHARCEPMESTSHPTIWLNAWKFDNQEEVWASLALATLEQIKQKHDIFWLMWFRIQLTFRRMSFIPALGVVLLQFALPLILGIIAFYYSLIIGSYDTPLEAFTIATQGYGNYLLWAGGILSGFLTVSSVLKDPFQIPVDKVLKGPNYKDKVGFLTRFEEDFARIINLVTNNGFGWKKSKLIIFVDDLDRCEPPKAADIVEAINLFLDADGCVFVIGMDSDSVAKSIEVKYKDLFDRIKAENAGVVSLGRAFLEKIVQIPFTVPRATPNQILNMVEDTLGGKISKGITIAQAKEQPVVVTAPESDQGVAEREDEPPAQHESTAQPEISTDESPVAKLDPASFARKEVRQAIHLGTELLSENPRQVKTFVNLFRLSIYIANARGFFEEGRKGEKLRLIGLDRLAIWVTCSVRWQNLIRHLYAETQMNSLCVFLYDVSKGITTEYKWTTGNKNIPTELKKKIDNMRKVEKSSEAHWCHLPWEWWLLEPDFLQVVKRMEDLWASPGEGEADQLKVLLNMSRPLSPTSSTEAK